MLTTTFGVVVTASALVVTAEPTVAASVMRPLLLLQAFSVSSGYLVPARRGHYDLLLTRGPGRVAAVGVHAAMSAAPGVVGWVALCLTEALVAGRPGLAIGSFGSAAALFVVSGVGWALTAPLPRFAGAVGWLLLRAALDVVSANAAVDNLPLHSPAGWVARAARVLVFPETLVGVPWSVAHGVFAWPAIGLTAAWLCLSVRGVARASLRLETGQ